MRGKILVVDDNRNLVDVLKMELELRGHTVLTAYDGEEGEESIINNKPDLVILDIMMPKKNGYEVCRNVKRNVEFSKIPIILLTAKSTKDDIYWGYDCGADAYVTKPYETTELLRIVDQLLQDYKEGKRTYAWTGLRDASIVEKEYKFRKEAGGKALLINIEFEEEPRDVFIQKYGMAKFRDFIHSFAWKMNNILSEVVPSTIVGQYADDTFLILLPESEEETIKQKVEEIFEEMVKLLYDDEDLNQKGIVRRNLITGKEEIIPLMKIRLSRVDL